MARNRPGGRPGKRALRYAVPTSLVGVVAAAVVLVPALADAGDDPVLPDVTAEELVARIAAADARQLSGTVRVATDLGLPALPGTVSGGDARDDGDGTGADPRRKLLELASGTHVLRVAVDGPDRQRVSVVEDAAEYSLVRNGGDVWAYDSADGAVHHTVLPGDAGRGHRRGEGTGGPEGLTPQGATEEVLDAIDATTSVVVGGTTRVAGRDAYQLLVEPVRQESTVDSVRIAVDAASGVPLRFTLVPSDGGGAAIDVGFTEVSFAEPDADLFAFEPPEGAEVTERRLDGARGGPSRHDRREVVEGLPELPGLEVVGQGWGSVLELRLPGGSAPGPSDRREGRGTGRDGTAPPEASGPPAERELLDAFTDQVHGKFGSGRLLSTRLVSALVTDDGTVYVGAVTKDRLVRAADGAAG